MISWMLWVVAATMTAGVVTLLLRSLFVPKTTPVSYCFDGDIYRDQLKELERERVTGQIGAVEAEVARAEICRRLLASAGTATPIEAAPARPPRGVAFGLAVFLPVVALAIYLAGGTPRTPSQPFTVRDESGHVAAEIVAEQAQALQQRLGKAPRDTNAWIELGRRWSELGESAKAADAYRHAIDLSDGDPVLIGGYGEALVSANGGTVTKPARAAFEEVLKLQPGDPRARYFLGLAYAQAGDDRAALNLWQGVMRDSPADAPWVAPVRQHLVEVAHRLGLDAKKVIPEPLPAAISFDARPAAIASLPPDTQAKEIRGMVDGLAARLQRSPNDLEGWSRLARARSVLGDAAAAADAYARAAALAPDDTELLHAYGDALLAAGRADEVPPVLEAGLHRMLAANPKDLVALWFLGVAAQKSGQTEKTRRLWGQIRDQLSEGSPQRAAIEQRIAQLPPPGID